MMKTPPTIPAPLPTDHRLLRLAGLLSVSKRDALGATVEAWAWIQAQATEGIVPQPVALLDGVAEIEGYGEAAVAVGLVGTADGHIVAPAELRQADAQGTARRAGTADDDARERERRQARDRQRRRRNGSRLTGKMKPTAPPDVAAATSTTPSRKRRRLGTLPGGYDIMLFWSKTNEEWFYKVPGSVPDLTGTVTDQDNPTLAAALKALMDARLTQVQKAKGRLDAPTFSPSMEQLVEAARREQADRQAAAVAAARVDEGNEAFARAAAADDDQGDAEPVAERFTNGGDANAKPQPTPTGDIEPGDAPGDCSTSSPADAAEPAPATADAPPDDPAERDCHAPVTRDKRDKRDCHASVTLDTDAKPLPGKGLDADFCHASVTLGSPSSSSSSLNELNEKENTTTTSVTADRERDAPGTAEQDDIFSRYLKATDRRDDFDRYLKAAGTAPPVDPATAARIQRLADALGSTPEAIRDQGLEQPDILYARLKAVGIDPMTGFPLATPAKTPREHVATARPAEDAPTSPQDAPGRPTGIGTYVQAVSSEQASGGIVAAPATTPPPTGSPDDVDALGSRLSHGLAAVTAGLLGDDRAEGRTDAEQQRRRDEAEQERRRDEAEQQRRRQEGLKAVAAYR
jgi:hypothetical protein